MKTNLIPLWPNLSRAYEIAKTGGFSITITFTMNSEYPQAFEDYKKIKEFYSDVSFIENGDIFLEIVKPHPNLYKMNRYETLEDINERVRTSKMNKTPSPILDSTCEALLTMAIQRMNFSSHDVDVIKKLAAIIAQMDNSDLIYSYHVSEAIHYRFKTSEEKYIIAENSLLKFGNNITINMVGVTSNYEDTDNIKNAIKYLKKLLR